jgi:hypothetical protein
MPIEDCHPAFRHCVVVVAKQQSADQDGLHIA